MASARPDRKSHLKTRPAEIVSTDEAVDLHRGEWIVMRVTSFDEKHVPNEGEVIAHSPSHSRLLKRFSKILGDLKVPKAHYYIFLGEPRARTGEEWRKQLDELAARPSTTT